MMSARRTSLDELQELRDRISRADDELRHLQAQASSARLQHRPASPDEEELRLRRMAKQLEREIDGLRHDLAAADPAKPMRDLGLPRLAGFDI